MTAAFAGAKAAYLEMRTAIGPWAEANGYKRWAGTQAGWQKAIGQKRVLFKFEGYSMVNPDTGNDLHGLVQLEPLEGPQGSSILRQASFSLCLVQAELDELAGIQGAINKRRPPVPSYLKRDLGADSLLGHDLRKTYDPSPKYREGKIIYLGYYSLRDAQDLAAFIARVLPQALERFLQERVAALVP